jgi:hypothetical protein
MALNRNPAGVAIFVFYPLMGALYAVPGVLLTRYANNIAQFVQSRQETDLATALDAQRSFGSSPASWASSRLSSP